MEGFHFILIRFSSALGFRGIWLWREEELMTIVRDVICMTVAHQDGANYSCVVYLSGEAAGQIARGAATAQVFPLGRLHFKLLSIRNVCTDCLH